MKIYLNPEVASGLGEDTFWTWFKREIPNTEYLNVNSKIRYNDVILHYSTMGESKYPHNTICLLWELYPEMKKKFNSNMWDSRISKIDEAIKSSRKITVSTSFTIEFYKDLKNIEILPIGLDTDIFKPLINKNVLRKKYGVPTDKRVGVWVGTTHKMKGFDKLLKYRKQNPDIFWIIIWKWEQESLHVNDKNCISFVQISQKQMNELYNCGDFFLSTSRLRPFFMSEWEALASNLPFVVLENITKDFVPSMNPRKQVFELGWDRKTAKKRWIEYINKFNKEKSGIEYVRYVSFQILNIIKSLNILFQIRISNLIKAKRNFKLIVKNNLNNFLCKINPLYRRTCRIEKMIIERDRQYSLDIKQILYNQESIDTKISKFLK